MQLNSCGEGCVPSGLEIRSDREVPVWGASAVSVDMVKEWTGGSEQGSEGVYCQAQKPRGSWVENEHRREIWNKE